MDYSGLLENKLEKMFPDEATRNEVVRELHEYGKEDYERESDRVYLCILKLADTDREEIRSCVAEAKKDYRDIIAYAEYPNQMKNSMSKGFEKEEAKWRKMDLEQFQAWLNSDP